MRELELGQYDGRPQQKKPRANGFTRAKRRRFLDALARSCNVAASARFAGIDKVTVYRHRSSDPVFRDAWRAALDAGYDRLETLLLEHGGAGEPLDPPDADRAADADPRPFNFDRAFALLRHHHARREGTITRTGGPERRNATREETNDALLKAIEGVRKQIDREKRRNDRE